ncbi:hypothetical protein MKEN_00630800 [Mycena kentingensis (nom. inval.)]|nr:hypothetical protein MKEN_00630800 [Mycena kentingensis (nom. inval.)]
MAFTPRTLAIIWAIACLIDIAVVVIYSILLDIQASGWRIAVLVLMIISAILAGYNTWRWWKVHKTQQEQLEGRVPLV